MKRASITVFCALCMMFIVSFLFTLLELSRVYAMDAYAKLKTEAGADSVCAEYQPLLWKEYGLLVLDGAYGTEHFSTDYVKESLEDAITAEYETKDEIWNQISMDLITCSLKEADISGYALLTDDEGQLFLDYVSERMKERLPIGMAQRIYEEYRQYEQTDSTGGGLEETITEAEEQFNQAKNSKWSQIAAKAGEAESEEEADEIWKEAFVFQVPQIVSLGNIFEKSADARTSDILPLILRDVSEVSSTVSCLNDSLYYRDKQEGNLRYTKERDWYRKILVLEYLETFFSNYKKEKSSHYFDYEMEYVLCGQTAEWRNLEETFKKILLTRELSNIASLLQDREKVREAEVLAETVGLLTGENPAMVKTVQAGILAAWAYAESVLDVRALACGEKIPLIKESSQWNSDMEEILTVFHSDQIAKGCEDGWDYTRYVKYLIYLVPDKLLAYRMMEVMEMGLRVTEDYRNCRMNHMIPALRCETQFEAKPLFFAFVTIGNKDNGKFCFDKEAERSYIP